VWKRFRVHDVMHTHRYIIYRVALYKVVKSVRVWLIWRIQIQLRAWEGGMGG